MRIKKNVFTTHETARYCQVDPFSIRNWIESGKLPSYRTPGGHRRIKRDELVKFLRYHKMPVPKDLEEVGVRILIVDDDTNFVQFLMEFIKSLPEETILEKAYNGYDAGRFITTFQPQVIILNIKLPGIDGFKVTSDIKRQESTKDISVFAVTTAYSQDVLNKIITAGASYCFEKPVNMSEFRRVLEKHVFQV